ncbi:hypothetical protein D3Z45_11495 [Lachnospiraceae bacterium]|nr:hypothetical protein [Lachnospiraceae bacterium]
MAKHIQEFIVHDYKGIHELKFDSLNSINILTGDNNCGKTSVLELLSTMDNPQYTGAWVLCSRMNNVRGRNRLFFNGFFNMFPIDNNDKSISYTYMDMENKLTTITLTATMEETQIPEKEMFRINGLMRTGFSKKEEEFIDTTCMHLQTYKNGTEINKDTIFDFQTRISHYISKESLFVHTTYVSPVEHATDMLYLNEILSNPELYEELLAILKEFDNNIINISALKSENSPFSSEYMVLTKNHQNALPLNAYGDGMKKAVLLLSAIVKSRGGILLLDEFETAIHTSAMDSIFSWLLTSALKLDVQVFLTSHSKEAIEKVLKSSTELQSHINLYTLYDFERKNYIRMMNCQEAIHAQENLGLELR